MKVALEISPLKSSHNVRGIGSYTKNLFEALKKEKSIDLVPFERPGKTPEADLIHYPYFDLFFHTLPMFGKQRLVVTIHDVIPLVFPAFFPTGKRAYINLFLQKLSLKRVNAVITDSETSKTDVADKLTFPNNKIHVVYLSQADIFKPQNPKLSLRKKYKLPEKFILYVGDVNWNKNILGLLQAIKFVNCKLVMVGKALRDPDTPKSAEIKQKIADLGISKLINLTGYVPDNDLVNIYNSAMLTVLPSFYEGFGLPVLESMACGTPVVCSNNSSLSEIGGPAIFCNPDNPEDIAEKITSVLNLNEIQYRHLKSRSIKHSKNFSQKKVASETIKVYKNLF